MLIKDAPRNTVIMLTGSHLRNVFFHVSKDGLLSPFWKSDSGWSLHGDFMGNSNAGHEHWFDCESDMKVIASHVTNVKQIKLGDCLRAYKRYLCNGK